ncbi:type III pantothenate kinase [Belliella pelovolcani]|uniref:Type III pantothenate kinase n=1 Tax=Belliella pelovolcani TaxID=529505 RepID=A0A1N7KNK1_9BACT|nr:type III pantothenate kinase [Belliella pelovolcani]SIS63124.1 type III pantothenate kinase [Belliella pelovolcani]
MRQFIVDIGNTRIKTAIFDGEEMLAMSSFESLAELKSYASEQEFEACLISSVKYAEEDLKVALGFDFLYLTRETAIPISNKYGTPDTLGVDRKAAVVGARVKFPEGNLLAIDLGSCITYDFLNAADEYLGGAISPGLAMRFKAMHQQTARLPLEVLNEQEMPQLLENSTRSGLRSGVYHGILFEMEGFIAAYKQQHQDLKVIICGGDSKFFETLTKDYIFVIPNLVLFGLNRILTYNVHKK